MRQNHSTPLLLLVALFVAADGHLSLPAHGAPPPATGVAVLLDGRVFHGALAEVAGGYSVKQPGGAVIVLPFEQVRLTAPDLPAAYTVLRDSYRQPTADDHLALAQWCLENALYPQARSELQQALRLEPLRQEARTLLQQIDQASPPPAAANAPAPAVTPAMSLSTFGAADDALTSGISRETHQEFMGKVQPLLMNKCGNAGCHSQHDTTSAFQLAPVRLGSSGLKAATADNLAEVFSQIDFQSPPRSPLLVKPGEATPAHQNLFLAAQHRQQYQLLESWVRRVVREKEATGTLPQPPARSSADAVIPAQHEREASQASSVSNPMPADPPGLLDRIRAQQQLDAFDPDVFNRRVHGVTREERQLGKPLP